MGSCAKEEKIFPVDRSHPPCAPCHNWQCHNQGKCQYWKNVMIGEKIKTLMIYFFVVFDIQIIIRVLKLPKIFIKKLTIVRM